MVTKARKRVAGARPGRPASGLERVKFFVRAAPADVDLFRAIRTALVEAETPADPAWASAVRSEFARAVTDAEVFHVAVRALLASLPEPVRAKLDRSRD